MHTKLVQFTLLIRVNARQREFNFRQRSPESFDVNTADERGERFYFKLVKDNNEWRISQQLLPAWLLNHESVIIEAFLANGFGE